MQNIHPLLDADKQRQAQKYEKENRIFGLLGSVISLTFVLWFYFFGFSTQIAHMGYSFIWTFLIYIVIFLTLSTLIGLPLGYYTGYVREHKWGFSNYTPIYVHELILYNIPGSRQTPILILHGTEDDIITVDKGQKAHDLLNKHGYCVRMETYKAPHKIPLLAGAIIKDFIKDNELYLSVKNGV